MSKDIPDDAGWYLDEYDGERFWSHVSYRGGIGHLDDPLANASGECWIWNGAGGDEYGRFRLRDSWHQAHRIAYLDFGMKFSPDQHADHLCRNVRCVRPSHIEAVTRTENVRRGVLGHKTHCPHGHEYTPDNTRIEQRKGREVRICKACRKAYASKVYQRRKQAA